jgi:acetate kinase
MMGTRSGSIDPGILTYLLRHKGYSADDLDKLLNKDSGLKGLSGISQDMREIEKLALEGHPRALLALEVFIHRLRCGIGAMTASLGGLDALVFTAGIGENSTGVRTRTCGALGYLGIRVDEEKNGRNSGDRDISAVDSRARILVIGAQEDWAIARAAWKWKTTGEIGG